ncbi:hypothetical protein GCM10009772_15470 [Pseudonocardia alni subsp. carboxydivorans]
MTRVPFSRTYAPAPGEAGPVRSRPLRWDVTRPHPAVRRDGAARSPDRRDTTPTTRPEADDTDLVVSPASGAAKRGIGG